METGLRVRREGWSKLRVVEGACVDLRARRAEGEGRAYVEGDGQQRNQGEPGEKDRLVG